MTGIKKCDLLIAGAGPVGLFAGILSQAAGLDFMIIDKNLQPYKHSRSAGIHPPSLALFRDAGLIDEFLKCGVRIQRGRALADKKITLGALEFGNLSVPYPFVLTVPQWKTEEILERALNEASPGRLLRGVTVKHLIHEVGSFSISTESMTGESILIQSQFILACDGKKSTIRHMAGIHFKGKKYPHRYVMGDFPDNTDFASDAVIYLSPDGLVESFPLPDSLRRWVVQQRRGTEHQISDIHGLVNAVYNRCGIMPEPEGCHMYSEFGVERYIAGTFWTDNLILAGDAAHIVSPIGGQGMNLGWLNVKDAISEIESVLHGNTTITQAAKRFNYIVRKRTWQVIKRSEWNMIIGNRKRIPSLRNYLVKKMLHSSISLVLKKRFTMQGLTNIKPDKN